LFRFVSFCFCFVSFCFLHFVSLFLAAHENPIKTILCHGIWLNTH
jgi:hypothetical protein